jgi:hypothetical protein
MIGPDPQTILTPPTEAAIFLVMCAEPGAEAGIRDRWPTSAGSSGRSASASPTVG